MFCRISIACCNFWRQRGWGLGQCFVATRPIPGFLRHDTAIRHPLEYTAVCHSRAGSPTAYGSCFMLCRTATSPAGILN